MEIRRTVAFSDHWAAQFARTLYYSPKRFSLPLPRIILVTFRTCYELIRQVWHFVRRAFWAEPLFKSYCSSYGEGLRTGIFVHWVQGRGEIILGDNVLIDGKCSFKFAARYANPPRLLIADNTGIGHLCHITVGKEVSIGKNCRIASQVIIFDSPGHPIEPFARLRGEPAPDASVRPVHIGDNVWIGRGAIIFPGVIIGDNCVVASGAVVVNDVSPNTIVAGNPARKTGVLPNA